MAPDTTRMTDEECDRIARRMVEVFANTPLDGSAPGPSDVKGENHIADAGKLVPLTDPTDVVGEWAMLRKFLVDVGDSLSAYDCNAGLAENLVRILAAVAKLKATAAEPAQKLVKLPEGAVVSIPLTAEQAVTEDRDRLFWVSSNRNMRVGWHKLLDPALYGVDAGAKIKQLEADLAESKACEEAVDTHADKVIRERNGLHSEVERLRKAIETHQRDAGTAMPFFENDMELWSLLAPKAEG